MTLELFQRKTHFDFIGKRYIAYAISVIAILIGVVAMYKNGGITYGVDFAGGISIQLHFEQPVQDKEIKKSLEQLEISGLMVQQFDDNDKSYLIRFADSKDMDVTSIKNQINTALNNALPDNPGTIQKIEMVGPKVGTDLRNAALEAIYYAILIIAVYISGRFEHRWFLAAGIACFLAATMYFINYLQLNMVVQVSIALLCTIALCWKFKLIFALGAITSLLHDVLITVGFLILMNKEFDLNIIAALLTLLGYSLNDTIIVYDRIRENIQEKNTHQPSLNNIINESINQTLGRTIMTSATTIVTAISLFIFGGGVIHDFALTMLLGIIIGTFSSIFVASPILLTFKKDQFFIEKDTSS